MTVLYKRDNLRGEERISVDLAVEITWHDSERNTFSERTRVEDVTSVGCRFRVGRELHPGDFVSIKPLVRGVKCLEAAQEQLFEIMWSAREEKRWTTGARGLEGEKLTKAKLLLSNPPSNDLSK